MKNNIKQLRKNERLTQEQLADKVEVSRQSIISIENGKYDPSLALAFKISKVFNKIVEEVFIHEEEEE